MIDEYFYSTLDKPYFQQNEFSRICEKTGLLTNRGALTIKEWNQFRKQLGKPRRFSRNFINQELRKLNLFRERTRIWNTKKQLIEDGMFSKELLYTIQNRQSLTVVISHHFFLTSRDNRFWHWTAHQDCSTADKSCRLTGPRSW